MLRIITPSLLIESKHNLPGMVEASTRLSPSIFIVLSSLDGCSDVLHTMVKKNNISKKEQDINALSFIAVLIVLLIVYRFICEV